MPNSNSTQKQIQAPLSTVNFAWNYIQTEKKSFAIALLFVIFNAGIATTTPMAIEFLVQNAIVNGNFDLIFKVVVGMCVIFAIEAMIFRYQVLMVGWAAQRIMLKIRSDLFQRLQFLKSEYFGRNQSGDLISRINSDTTKIDDFLGQYLFSFTSSFFVFLAFGIYLATLNLNLALIAYFGVFLTIIVSYSLSPIIKSTNSKALSSNGQVKGFLADNLNNFQVIESYNINQSMVNDFESLNLDNQKANYKSRIFTNIFGSIYNFTGNIAIGLVLAFALWTAQTNLQNIAELLAFVFATIKFFGPMRDLGSVFSSMAESAAALVRVREILDEPINDAFSTSTDETKFDTNSKNAVSFANVSFAYPSLDKKVLDSISFQVPINCKFAIIGPTGEGKSTIAKLISGLLSPTSGDIQILGKPLKDWNQSDFYSQVGFILQDPFLFNGTVASNIIYGNPSYQDYVLQSQNASDDLIPKLIKDIQIHNLDSIIPNLEEFLNTEVTNNSQNISQKQIINFIRVLLREPKILILDEATANLDTITEKYLQDSLDKLTSKVTQIIIAHRQNTIKDADYVMLVGGGKVEVRE
jgi:ATP-binding cassette, subfamily B, bacterial